MDREVGCTGQLETRPFRPSIRRKCSDSCSESEEEQHSAGSAIAVSELCKNIESANNFLFSWYHTTTGSRWHRECARVETEACKCQDRIVDRAGPTARARVRAASPGPALVGQTSTAVVGQMSECFQPSLHSLNSNHHCSLIQFDLVTMAMTGGNTPSLRA